MHAIAKVSPDERQQWRETQADGTEQTIAPHFRLQVNVNSSKLLAENTENELGI